MLLINKSTYCSLFVRALWISFGISETSEISSRSDLKVYLCYSPFSQRVCLALGGRSLQPRRCVSSFPVLGTGTGTGVTTGCGGGDRPLAAGAREVARRWVRGWLGVPEWTAEGREGCEPVRQRPAPSSPEGREPRTKPSGKIRGSRGTWWLIGREPACSHQKTASATPLPSALRPLLLYSPAFPPSLLHSLHPRRPSPWGGQKKLQRCVPLCVCMCMRVCVCV